jgi:hypothetical protein
VKIAPSHTIAQAQLQHSSSPLTQPAASALAAPTTFPLNMLVHLQQPHTAAMMSQQAIKERQGKQVRVLPMAYQN